MVEACVAGLGDPARLVAADVGAGTGISARLLADRVGMVFAVEPNRPMREAAAPHPRVEWVDGTAEATGLPAGSVDLVLCAQAFHWFDPPVALAEFRRVLRDGGRVALAWNERDDDDSATREYGAVVRTAAGNDPGVMSHDSPIPLLEAAGLRNARRRDFPHGQTLTEEGLVGRALSASYVPKTGPVRDTLVAALRALFARHGARSGTIRLVYRTSVYLAETPVTAGRA
jgi:SAM-dependent methyltransferase